MRKLINILVGCILLFPTYSFSDAQKIGKHPKIYNADNYVVTILRIGKKEDENVLIKVDGIDNDFDGQIYLHTKKCDTSTCKTFKYETKEIPGKERWWTLQSVNSWGDYNNLSLYPPGVKTKSRAFKVKSPKGFDSKKFYQEYLGQKALREKSN